MYQNTISWNCSNLKVGRYITIWVENITLISNSLPNTKNFGSFERLSRISLLIRIIEKRLFLYHRLSTHCFSLTIRRYFKIILSDLTPIVFKLKYDYDDTTPSKRPHLLRIFNTVNKDYPAHQASGLLLSV